MNAREISAETGPGEGSLLRFPTELARARRQASLSGTRVLLVEDQPLNRNVVRGMIEGLGGSVDAVGNGLDAVEVAARDGYDVILMDCEMPVMDGYAATAEIRRLEKERAQTGKRQRIPILAMTGHAMDGERDRCFDSGMDDYLGKPFNREQLLALLGRWLEVRPAVAEARAETPLRPAPDRRALPAIDVEDQIRLLWEPLSWEAAQQILVVYAETSPGLVKSMGEALARGNLETVGNLAHPFKSCSALLGANRLADLGDQIGKAVADGSAKRVAVLLRELETEFERVLAELERGAPVAACS